MNALRFLGALVCSAVLVVLGCTGLLLACYVLLGALR